jgi:hypothetical protein
MWILIILIVIVYLIIGRVAANIEDNVKAFYEPTEYYKAFFMIFWPICLLWNFIIWIGDKIYNL